MSMATTDDETENLTTIVVTTVIMHDGSIVVLEGTDEDGKIRRFGADHRMAQPILEELADGLEPWASVPSWAFLGGAR
jgi:hypothetical protein